MPMIRDDRLGRLYAEDPRDERYALRTLTQAVAPPQQTRISYRRGTTLDQGSTPRCVAFAARHKLDAAPHRTLKGPQPQEIYDGAQANDEWPGNEYDGTSGRGALKFLRSIGMIVSFWRAWNTSDILDAMLQGFGPVLIGVNWYTSMFEPRKVGSAYLLEITPNARVVGGHEPMLYAADRLDGTFGLLNSWGPSWAKGGTAVITIETVQRLLDEDGDAFVAIERGAKAPDPSVAIHYED